MGTGGEGTSGEEKISMEKNPKKKFWGKTGSRGKIRKIK